MKAVAEGKRRAKAKAVGGAVNLADNCSFFFYSGEDLICQKDLGAEVVPESDAPEKVNGAYYQPKFLLTDHLGTTRAELMFDATLQPKLAKTYDTMPYGELISVPTGRPEPVLFSGKLRDMESGLDFFGVRYYNNNCGRWNSPDQPFVDNHVENPQSWNLYCYVGSNPVNKIDKDGRIQRDSNGNPLVLWLGTTTITYKNNVPQADGNTVTVKWQANVGVIYTDNGTPITITKPTSDMTVNVKDQEGNIIQTGGSELAGWPVTDLSSNCIGDAFVGGGMWVDPRETPALLKGDYYTETDKPTSGDVGVYSTDQGVVKHAVTVNTVDNSTGEVTTVASKGGVLPKTTAPPGPGLNAAWKETDTTVRYYKKQQ